ncbi:MAG: LacI family DNA-binding transcriptional regulator [Paracoccaceae bacterium]|nr:LacI family DNA-binding transcriptional regulator [Paracoccaceae bacterium]
MMADRGHAATIYDVARAAGVSPKTVSRVLNGDAPVSDGTRAAVEAASFELGYVPSSAARMMRSKRSGLIGLITGALSQKLEPMDPTGLPDLYIVQGIQQVIADSGKTLMIADTGGASERVPQLVRTFLQHRVEALVYVADYHKEVALDTGNATCPIMLVNCFDSIGTPAVVPDDESCQFELIRKLILEGHRRIAFLTLNSSMVAARKRSQGYRHALAEAGIPYDPDLERMSRATVDDDAGELLSTGLDAMLSLDTPPTVICCGNDEMALRVYGLIRSRGLRIPEDMSVAGFDNYRAIAETLYPPLTTVELPYLAMGRRAAERTLSLINDKATGPEGPEVLAGPVFWRSSVTAL